MIVVLFVGLVNVKANADQQTHNFQVQQTHKQQQLKKLNTELHQVQVQKSSAEQTVQEKAKHEADLQKQIDDLNAQLQAKREAQATLASAVPAYATPTQYQPIKSYAAQAQYAQPIATGVVGGCGDNSYAQYIYQHESGCRLNATNAGGCVGIGQACPGSKLYAVCPDLNYGCQNSFFTSYANAAYGGWAGAYSFWIAHSWW